MSLRHIQNTTYTENNDIYCVLKYQRDIFRCIILNFRVSSTLTREYFPPHRGLSPAAYAAKTGLIAMRPPASELIMPPMQKNTQEIFII